VNEDKRSSFPSPLLSEDTRNKDEEKRNVRSKHVSRGRTVCTLRFSRRRHINRKSREDALRSSCVVLEFFLGWGHSSDINNRHK
jgi:hypothetical protein